MFGCFVVQSVWISAPACSEKYVKNHKYVDSGSEGITREKITVTVISREKITVTVISEHSLPSARAPFPGQYYVVAAHSSADALLSGISASTENIITCIVIDRGRAMYMSRKRLVIEDFPEKAEIFGNRLITENVPERTKISAIANCSGDLGEAEHGDCRFRKMASADTDTSAHSQWRFTNSQEDKNLRIPEQIDAKVSEPMTPPVAEERKVRPVCPGAPKKPGPRSRITNRGSDI